MRGTMLSGDVRHLPAQIVSSLLAGDNYAHQHCAISIGGRQLRLPALCLYWWATIMPVSTMPPQLCWRVTIAAANNLFLMC
jgi:hypothetical protein